MNTQGKENLMDDLQRAQQQMSDLLLSVANDQDWQPDADNWSFRYVAAHMAACDKECLLERIQQIASGENPQFAFYDNSERDFSGVDLRDALDEWAATRQEIIEFFRALSDDKLALTGDHATYGAVTVPDYLKIGLDHDLGHMQDLEKMLAQYRQR